MSPIDRFTRDERSAVVWWPFALLLIVLCIATIPGEHRVIESERSSAATRSVGYLQGVLAPALGSTDLVAPLNGATADAVRSVLRHDVLGDGRIDAVRLWSPEGVLLFSTLPKDAVGSGEALNDAQIHDAAADPGAPVSIVTDTTPEGRSGPTTFQTYLGLTGTAKPVVGEVEFSDAVLLSSVHSAWLGYRILVGFAGLLVLGLALLSMREPKAKMGAGVPFYETSIPRGYALIDLEEQARLQQAGAHAKTRVAHVEARLLESEEARRKAEGQLQRALSAIATRVRPGGVEPALPRAAGTPTAPVPVAAAPAAPASVPPVVAPAIQPAAAAEPVRKKVAPAHEPPARTPKKKPAVVPEPVVRAPEPAPVARAAEAEPVVVPEPEPVVVPEPEPIVALEPAEPVARAEPVLELPAVDRGVVLRVPDSMPATDDESAVEVLERLVEPVPAAHTDVDPGVVRARLARLAASKKPGSRSEEPLGDQHRGS